MSDLLSDMAPSFETIEFKPTRKAALARLDQFVSRAGRHYARQRNFDFGHNQRSNVSCLSPWLRHRLVTETEVLTRVLAAHGLNGAEKFIQEVFWRSYFKGWMEQHPSVWTQYRRDLLEAFQDIERDGALKAAYRDAVTAHTGIECFDHWMRELIATGYLHNHTRMWMASIWIFTLRLPWQLGADIFLKYLLDGDPASNTLSWRWVAGLHTKGKTYLARPDNIAKYTQGQFSPKGLATEAIALHEATPHPRIALPAMPEPVRDPYLVLVTEDDLSATAFAPDVQAGILGLMTPRSSHPIAAPAENFTQEAMKSALAPLNGYTKSPENWAEELIAASSALGVRTIATAYAPVGPAQSQLRAAMPQLAAAGLRLEQHVGPYDATVWPHAKAGFFGLKKKIPDMLRALGLAASVDQN